MLTLPLLHPPLLAALASAGHGARIVFADGNYPHSTGAHPAAARIWLNLAPGLLTVDPVLDVVAQAVPIESATFMVPDDGPEPAAHAGYRARLGGDVPVREVGRFEFYAEARQPDVAAVIATADQRLYACMMVTIGVRPGS